MNQNRPALPSPAALAVIAIAAIGVLAYEMYTSFLIEVPSKHMAILVHKTGKDLDNTESIAPSEEYKGVQPVVLTEGRYYYNPYNWAWTVVPQIEIPAGKLGVRIRLYGENLPTGELIAFKDSQKGIVPEILRPGPLCHQCATGRSGRQEAPRSAQQRLCRDHRVARSGDDPRRLQGREDPRFRAACREAQRGHRAQGNRKPAACRKRPSSRARII